MKTPTKAAITQRASRAKKIAGAKIKSGTQAARIAGKKAGESVENYPVAALIGGLAMGAAVGALLPRTKSEESLLGSLGESINDRAREAALAARDAGQAKLDQLGISKDAAGKQVGKLIEAVAEVAEVAGSAAVDAVKH